MSRVIRSRRMWLAIAMCLLTVLTGYAWAKFAPNHVDEGWITEDGVTFKWQTHNGVTYKLLKEAPKPKADRTRRRLPAPVAPSTALPVEFVSVMSPEPIVSHRVGNGGNVLSMTDPEGQVTQYEFDDLGRIIRTIYPDHVPGSSPGDAGYGITETAYDPLGRIARTTDQTGSTITYVYDFSDRLIRKEYRTLANSPSGTIADQDEMTYDAQGRLLSATSGRYGNTVARTYDEDGRLASESLTIDGQTYTATATYGVASPTMTLTYPDGSVVVKTMNDRGLLTSVTRNGNPIVTRTHTDAGRLATQTFGNGVIETWTWTSDGQLASIDNPAGLFEYTYDANKNRTAETITGPLADASWTTGTNGFDDDDRLVYRNQGNGDLVEAWDLSLVGDWHEYTRNGVSETRTHGPTHELLNVGNASLTYDSRGNLTTDEQGRLLSWDADNRLTGVDVDADAAADVEYLYDAFSRRVARREWDRSDPMNPSSTTEVYAFWHDDVIADYTSGTTPTAPLRDYVLGQWVDELLLAVDRTEAGSLNSGTDEPFYYHKDAVTSVRAISNGIGTVVEYYKYSAYGEPTVLDNTLAAQAGSLIFNRNQFTCRAFDSATRYYYFRQRWLSPAAGQFTSRDPMGYIDGLSIYRAYFVPLSVDPFGLKVYWCSRDLDGLFIGNHGYLVIVPDKPGDFPGLLIDLFGGNQGFTMGGHTGPVGTTKDCLIYLKNQKADVAAVQEKNDPPRYDTSPGKYKDGWSLSCNTVAPPGGMSDTDFIKKLLELADNYEKNNATAKCPYGAANNNCQAWVNTILQQAGVGAVDREVAGEFPGVDWGEEDSLDTGLFKPPSPPTRRGSP